VAAKPVSEKELGVLHERIGRDLAELRRRWESGPHQPSRQVGDLVAVLVEVFRVVQAARGVLSSLRPAVVAVTVLCAACRSRPRPSPRRGV
jgi:hypothetical protein